MSDNNLKVVVTASVYRELENMGSDMRMYVVEAPMDDDDTDALMLTEEVSPLEELAEIDGEFILED